MADGTEDIMELLRSLLSDSDKEKKTESEGGEDPFSGIDIDMIMKLGTLMSEMNRPNKDAELILALKPHLRAENREKADKAVKLLRLLSLLPLLKDSGLSDILL